MANRAKLDREISRILSEIAALDAAAPYAPKNESTKKESALGLSEK
jgi:hypothetical protein